nr:exportin-7-like [Oryctolagus cuniculus]
MDQVYALYLKVISICFFVLKAPLSSSYVNFRVFCLYDNDALDNALQIFIKLLLSILHRDLLDYPKLSQSYYSLLKVLNQDHMNFIASLDPHVIMYIISSISEGLTALDTTGVHRLLLLPEPHHDIPLQAAVMQHHEENDPPDPGE